MKNKFKLINKIIFISFILLMICELINYSNINTKVFLLVLCILPLIVLPYILDKIKVFKISEKIIFLYYVFLIISLVLGGIFGFYKNIWWYDLFVHFISGILTSLIAYILLEKNKLLNKEKVLFNLIFIIIFTIAIAGIWEFIEFSIDKVFDYNTQQVITTGVSDTMEDMLIATLGGIISSIYYLIYSKKKYRGGLNGK